MRRRDDSSRLRCPQGRKHRQKHGAGAGAAQIRRIQLSNHLCRQKAAAYKAVKKGAKAMQSSSIGIIGGADGPTAIFMTGGSLLPFIIIGIAVITAVAAAFFFYKK